jgi:hypothetical protein
MPEHQTFGCYLNIEQSGSRDDEGRAVLKDLRPTFQVKQCGMYQPMD